MRDALVEERLCDSPAAAALADVHELDVRTAPDGRLDSRDADRTGVVLGEEDPARANVVEDVRPLVRPRLRILDLPGHLALELLPELAQHRLVGLGSGTNRHGTYDPVKR
jgi:hypothetical protein